MEFDLITFPNTIINIFLNSSKAWVSPFILTGEKKLFYLTENLMSFYFLRWVRHHQGIRAQVLLERYSWHILYYIYRCIWHESITMCNWVIRGADRGLHMLLWLERREGKNNFFLQRNSHFYELAKERNGPHWWNHWSFAYGQLYLIDT